MNIHILSTKWIFRMGILGTKAWISVMYYGPVSMYLTFQAKPDRNCFGIVTHGHRVVTLHANAWTLNMQRNLWEILLNQTEVRLYLLFSDWFWLIPNQSENGKYNLTSVWINKIPKSFLCVWSQKCREKMAKYVARWGGGAIFISVLNSRELLWETNYVCEAIKHL